MISKTRYNNEEEQRQQEESDEEEYQTDNQYEQDRLTDDNAYSEYFEDDENKGDRFTEDYNEDLRLANCILCETGQVSGSTEKCIEKLLDNKTEVSAKIVVIAAGPMDAYSLFDDNDRPDVLSKIAKEAKPIRLVCLDVALSSLPDKDTLFALGVDHPLYFSVHSAYAKLAPKGGALIHVAKYLGTSIQPKPREDQPELEAFLDLLQPGWRQVLVKKRPLPNMVVSNALVTAADGGLSGRPNPRIAENLYIVGDWVGKEGLVSNAAVASAKNAAQQILNE